MKKQHLVTVEEVELPTIPPEVEAPAKQKRRTMGIVVDELLLSKERYEELAQELAHLRARRAI